jgi:carbonic anhydrase/acetyltransferase-like protein (isoleucine patch superfamily)
MDKVSPVRFGRDVYIAPTAYLAGDLIVGDQCTIMHHVVIRADIAPIRIGARVNVQDGSILHTGYGVPLEIADEVGIGHRAVVHCRWVGTRTLVGVGAVVLDDAEIGDHCIVGAGAVVPPGMVVPSGKVLMGVPAKVVRDVTEEDLKVIDEVVENYLRLGRRHSSGEFPNIAAQSPNER